MKCENFSFGEGSSGIVGLVWSGLVWGEGKGREGMCLFCFVGWFVGWLGQVKLG